MSDRLRDFWRSLTWTEVDFTANRIKGRIRDGKVILDMTSTEGHVATLMLDPDVALETADVLIRVARNATKPEDAR